MRAAPAFDSQTVIWFFASRLSSSPFWKKRSSLSFSSARKRKRQSFLNVKSSLNGEAASAFTAAMGLKPASRTGGFATDAGISPGGEPPGSAAEAARADEASEAAPVIR